MNRRAGRSRMLVPDQARPDEPGVAGAVAVRSDVVPAPAGPAPVTVAVGQARGLGARRGHSARRVTGSVATWRRPTVVASIVILAFWVIAGLFWRLIVPYGPDAANVGPVLTGPSGAHLLGTDWLGRDVFSRLLAGAGTVISLAPQVTVIAVVVGSAIGLVGGYYRGAVDTILMRVVDVIITLPAIVIAILVLTVLGRSSINLVIVIALFFSPLVARTVRSAVLAEREREYVDAARLRKEPGAYVLLVEILPNVASPILVEAAVRLGYAVFTIATLSFLGLGPQEPSPDWGLTVSIGIEYVQAAPFTVLAPAVAIASLVVSVNVISDALRKAMLR